MKALRRESIVYGALLLLLALVLGQLGFFDPTRLSRGVVNLITFSKDMIPPDVTILPLAGRALFETVQMAFAGTFLGFLLSLPLGILGTRTLFPPPFVLTVRVIVGVIRTIPSLLWAVLFVIVVGLGPLAGTLALAFYTVGYLAKLYAEFFEGVDPEIVEAAKGVGANRLHLARFVIWPESANSVLSQLLFMFEYNIRASAILGFVGAGGIGFYMQAYLNTLSYQRLATLLMMIFALVLAMDLLSTWIRKRYLPTT
ncbi:MAG: phosphonate ABC transporter, permease protein PhnE [Armatimonadota bacterium]|nr:phosphonate ABC transporter, permease protein PhnE [Armatimonadota bacterium]